MAKSMWTTLKQLIISRTCQINSELWIKLTFGFSAVTAAVLTSDWTESSRCQQMFPLTGLLQRSTFVNVTISNISKWSDRQQKGAKRELRSATWNHFFGLACAWNVREDSHRSLCLFFLRFVSDNHLWNETLRRWINEDY